jgi:hypothetical protein
MYESQMLRPYRQATSGISYQCRVFRTSIKHHFVGDMGHVFEMGSGPTTGNIARVPEHIHRHISHTNRLMVHVMGGWLFGWFGGFVARQVGGRMGGGRAGR